MNNLLKQVDKEIETCPSFNPVMAFGMLEVRKMIVEECHSIVSFPRLNGLKPDFASCKDKLFEEIGEYLQLTGKGMKASGEQGESFTTQRMMIDELADVAQSAVTQMHFIADEAGIDLDEVMAEHERKLREKGYLK